MPTPFILRAQSILDSITNASDFEESLHNELVALAGLTDDVALVVIGQLYFERRCTEVLASFFNYEHARSRLDDFQSFGTLITLLRLTNLCSDSILNALKVLANIRNRFAHDIAYLTVLDLTPGTENKLADSFAASCKALRVTGGSSKDRYIDWLKKMYVALSKVNLVAQEMTRQINSASFVDSLNPIVIP